MLNCSKHHQNCAKIYKKHIDNTRYSGYNKVIKRQIINLISHGIS